MGEQLTLNHSLTWSTSFWKAASSCCAKELILVVLRVVMMGSKSQKESSVLAGALVTYFLGP